MASCHGHFVNCLFLLRTVGFEARDTPTRSKPRNKVLNSMTHLSSHPCNPMGNRNDSPVSPRRELAEVASSIKIFQLVGDKNQSNERRGDIFSQVLNVRITPRIFSCTLRSAVHSKRTCSRVSSSVITANRENERPVDGEIPRGRGAK